ncbi:MAG: translation initiation factor IF-2, partial [Acidobacteriota bacterium]
MKIRINDLARELEVKSKAILDVLPLVGVTEKKTHSSSIEADEAVRVRAHFQAQSEAQGAGSARSTRARGEEPDAIKTKIDLSHISKPGDVLKLITQKQQAASAPPVKRPAPPAPAAPPAVESKPVAASPATAQPPVAPAKPVVPPPAAAPSVPAAQPPVAQPPSPKPVIAPPPARPVAPLPPAQAVPPAVAPVSPPAQPPAQAQPTASAQPVQSQRPTPAAPPPRRMIVPQTGPRPVYKAPTPPPRAESPAASPSPQARPMPGRPIAGRPAPGRPVPGQPIFQRPRPSGPGARPPLRPGERRPMHPTRQAPGGPRPMGVGPGAPPTPRPGSRPGGPARRPGQRYVPRGVKEGPMKGFVPPPRLPVNNEPLPITRAITIAEGISVKDLAEKLGVRAKDVIARLLAKGVFATINQTLDAELASEMARFFGAEASVISFEQQAAQEAVAAETATEEALGAIPRPPVVTIMGHVDHGKTTLLDSIRSTNVAGGEAGGITQHIGAYKVKILDTNSPAYGREIVFLDTPGHEAFTRMRSRGAKATDIVVLVVAADDGVMPQTIEAIDHARAAEVPIIVAVNKVDKPDALPDRVKKQLADRGLMPEDWGGTTVFVDVSAKQKTNLNLLMEMICLVADLQELKANPDRPAQGVVLEAKLDRGRGPVATVLVQNGTLHNGANFVLSNVFGKVRAMFNDRGVAL